MSGVIATEADTKAAVQALVDAGFSMGQEGILIFQGEEGARQIDVRGEQHGFLAKLLRTAQALTNELDHVQDLEQELLAGPLPTFRSISHLAWANVCPNRVFTGK